MVISLTTKKKVREHFDLASPFYQELWGVHIHHGYYATGKESKQAAQQNLLRFVVDRLQLKPKTSILDIGCGIGGSTIWFTKNFGCKVTGITVAPAQVEMAKANTKSMRPKPRFLVDDADDMKIEGRFDYALAIEVLSHLHDRDNFFGKLAKLVKKGGRIVIGAWQRDIDLSKEEVARYIKPIEFGMMVSLPTLQDYMDQFERHGFRLVSYDDLNDKVSKTWDLGLGIISKPALWRLAGEQRAHFINFLKAFKAMKNGYKSGAFRYGLIVAERI